MKLSAIITTYNRPHFLEVCLQSVLAQEGVALEVIVVDDGTPGDANLKICSKFPEVAYYKIENSGGPAKPRNFGYSKSKGAYIAFLDDDDQWLPFKSASQIALLEEHPDFDLVHSPMRVINEDGSSRDEVCGVPGTAGYKHGWVADRMVGNFTLMMPTVLLRRALFEAAGGFDESLPSGFEDIDFWTRCSFFGKFYYQEDITALYRATAGGLSRNNPLVVNQPLYLLKGIKTLANAKKVAPAHYQSAIHNLVIDQIRRLHLNFSQAFINLFKIQITWFLNFRALKSATLELYRMLFTTYYKKDARR